MTFPQLDLLYPYHTAHYLRRARSELVSSRFRRLCASLILDLLDPSCTLTCQKSCVVYSTLMCSHLRSPRHRTTNAPDTARRSDYSESVSQRSSRTQGRNERKNTRERTKRRTSAPLRRVEQQRRARRQTTVRAGTRPCPRFQAFTTTGYRTIFASETIMVSRFPSYGIPASWPVPKEVELT